MNLQTLLNKYKIKADINMLLEMWNESHRKYHNLNHFIDINNMIEKDYKNNKFDEKTMEKLVLANLFHEIIYNPAKDDNESKSAEFLISLCLEKNNTDILDIENIILDTKTHIANTPLSETFNKYDMNIVERDFSNLLEWEEGIKEEYKIYDKETYKNGRIRFLESLLDKYPSNSINLEKLIEHVKFSK